MKITFIAPTLNFKGGLRVIATYADYLSRFGHDVTVVSPGKRTPNVKNKIKSFIKRTPWDEGRHFSTIYFDSLDIKLIILDKFRPVEEDDVPNGDVVIATWWETAHWVNKFSEIKGRKFYFMQDYGDVPGQPIDKIQETWMLPFHIITISQWLMNLVESHKQNDELLTLVVNGIELSVFNTKKRDKQKSPTVGFLYTDVPQKGIDLMFSSFLKVKETLPELRLIMFGSKDLPPKLQNFKDVTYYQKLPDKDIVKVYAACDAWLFGSEREGFGLPILEAMACRTPVISTNAGAAPDLVTSKSGVLLTSHSIDEMSKEILAIVNLDNNSWKTLSDGARQVAETYTWEIASRKFENALLE
ncbi:MAG: glycosyltransferase family 4 protein [Cycloclasticus sp.]|nr:glycosyltransferase family 4 protein [Cycloclasticus sp.]